MNLLFEEDGDIKGGHILEALGGSEPTSYQVELTSGRRAKVKASQVLLTFANPTPEQVLRDGPALAAELDTAFLWEVAPREEFEVAALGADYFGHAPTPTQWLALHAALQAAPVYFRRKGRGRYKPAPEHELQAALLGLEKRRLQAEQQRIWVEQLKSGTLPEGWAERAAFLAFKPDKNSTEYKALEQAAHELQTTIVALLYKVGGFASAKDIHRHRFLVEWFPGGTECPWVTVPDRPSGLPRATAQAFSIDDSMTTEIDDAFSVTWMASDTVRIGIHIAAPGCAITPGSALDVIARQRLSTVYMPGEKITMLPDAVVEVFTLAEGRHCPALSLYADFAIDSGTCIAQHTCVEEVFIAANLRHDLLDAQVTEATLADTSSQFPFKAELQVLWRIAQHLAAQREQVRGKPEPRNRADYLFRIESINGHESVRIEQRRRDAPLDRLVAEWMIFANSTWGRVLEQAGVPGIYRTQTHWARPGSRQSAVKMSTVPAPHIGIGVQHYAWSSSPLRRYVDLVNQWQLLAVAQGSQAPFGKNDAELFAIIGAFDAAYAAYADAQSDMERYWSLRWLQQEGWVGNGRRLAAVILRHEQARLLAVPLAAPLAGTTSLPVGTQVEVEVLDVHETELSLALRLVAVTQSEPATAADWEALEEETLPDDAPDTVSPTPTAE